MTDSAPSHRLRICVATTSYPRSSSDDASVFIRRLVEALHRAGHTVTVVVPSDTAESTVVDEEGVTVHRIRYVPWGRGRVAFGAGIMPNIRRRPWLIIELALLVLAMAAALVRLRGKTEVVQANWVIAGLSAWLASFVTRTPYVVAIRGMDALLLRARALRWIVFPMMRSAQAIVTVSEELRREISASFSTLSAVVACVPNGVEMAPADSEQQSRFLARYGLRSVDLVAIGSVTPRKDLATIIRALPSLPQRHLVVGGKCGDLVYLESLRDLARSLGVAERVSFLDSVPPESIPALLSAARCLVSASSFEGRPNAVLEAMAVGTPVVVSDIPAHREIVRSGYNGVLFDLGSESSLRGAFEQLEVDTALRERCVINARDQVRSLNWSTSATLWGEIMQRAVRKG